MPVVGVVGLAEGRVEAVGAVQEFVQESRTP